MGGLGGWVVRYKHLSPQFAQRVRAHRHNLHHHQPPTHQLDVPHSASSGTIRAAAKCCWPNAIFTCNRNDIYATRATKAQPEPISTL